MSNHVNFYRVEHSTACFGGLKESIGIGPYIYTGQFQRAFVVKPNSPLLKLTEYLRKFEPRPLRYGRENVYPNKTLPASYNWVRPGPREDPELREWFKQTYLNGNSNYNKTLTTDQMMHEPIVFGFNNEWQLRRWFFDKDEFSLLEQMGFVVVKRRINSKNIVQGFAQGLWKIKDLVIQQ